MQMSCPSTSHHAITDLSDRTSSTRIRHKPRSLGKGGNRHGRDRTGPAGKPCVRGMMLTVRATATVDRVSPTVITRYSVISGTVPDITLVMRASILCSAVF